MRPFPVGIYVTGYHEQRTGRREMETDARRALGFTGCGKEIPRPARRSLAVETVTGLKPKKVLVFWSTSKHEGSHIYLLIAVTQRYFVL
jgi:hypothetical protein